jgi:hypothetical protein
MEVVVRGGKVRREALKGLDWAMNEIADNVLVHANAPAGGLVAVTRQAKRRRVQFVVADAGDGIPATMRTGHPRLRNELQAVRQAIKQGVTRDKRVGAGNGLAGALRIATAAGGKFSVHSGRASISADHREPEPAGYVRPVADTVHGTVVFFEIGIDRKFDLERVLLQDGIAIIDWDFFDAAYQVDEGDVRLLIKDEVASTGTRAAGAPVRHKARNLADATEAGRVVLDFTGIESMTSSFVDEIIGKLVLALGPEEFTKRIAIEGLSDSIHRGLAARSMAQRREQAEAAASRRRRAAKRRKDRR